MTIPILILLKEIKDIDFLSYTTDIWSSEVCPMSLLSLTVHWLDTDMTPYSAALQAKNFPGSHSSKARKAYSAQQSACHSIASVESEWSFSTVSKFVDEKRNRLTAERAEMLVFLTKKMSVELK